MLDDLLPVSALRMVWEGFLDNEGLPTVSPRIVCPVSCEVLVLLLGVVLVEDGLPLDLAVLPLALLEEAFPSAVCFTDETASSVIFALALVIAGEAFGTLLSR